MRKAVHFLVTLLTALYLITGLGITEFRTVTPLTFGILNKALSQQLHSYLLVPFILLLALHVYFALTKKGLPKIERKGSVENAKKER